MKFSLALVALLVPAVEAFSVATVRKNRVSPRFMGDEPSDVDNVVVDIPSQTVVDDTPMVTSVLDQLPPGLGGEVSAETRASINEALLKLEALNPTTDPAYSPLVNGVWELRYAAGYSAEWALPSPTRQLALFLYSGGYSPGLFALSLAQKFPSNVVDVGPLEIAVSREQPRVEAKVGVKFFGSQDATNVVVKASLYPVSGVRLKETYESATVLDKQAVEIPERIRYARDLYVTYVDEELLVIRDASGVPEVLVRKDKSFPEWGGTQPDEVQDMSAPGEA